MYFFTITSLLETRKSRKGKKLLASESVCDLLLEDEIEFTEDCVGKIDDSFALFPWIDCEVESAQDNIIELEPSDKDTALECNWIMFPHGNIHVKDKNGWQKFTDNASPFDFLSNYQLVGDEDYVLGRASKRTTDEKTQSDLFLVDEIFDHKEGQWVHCFTIGESEAFEATKTALTKPKFEKMAINVELVKFALHFVIENENLKTNEISVYEKSKKVTRYMLRGNYIICKTN